uniref:EF-hand domain-containing protein n=1 Tax=viral metagenome TaxID=1070528 RepID=A0A6C0D3T5_9ZZZZ
MSYENRFLQQIFIMRDSLNNVHFEMLENIFNIYDYDGDGMLNEEEYISFISDIMYISVLMKRMKDSEYTMTNVNKIARWSRSNFKSNLFREPVQVVSHDLFLEEILYGLTENLQIPLYGEGFSLVPELIQYFNYYVDVAKRRGWPTEFMQEQENPLMQEQENKLMQENQLMQENLYHNGLTEPVLENTIQTIFQLPICITNRNHFYEYMKSVTPKVPTIVEEPQKPQLTPQQQMHEYQERRRQKYKEEKEAKEREEREKEEEKQRILENRRIEQERTNAILREQQIRIEAEQREQENITASIEDHHLRMEAEQALIYIDPADHSRMRELEQTIQQLERVQRALRDLTRQQGYDLGIDQIDGEVFVKAIEHIGEIDFSREQDGFDPIEANVNVLDFLDEEPADRIAFKCGESYYIASRERIRNMINLENSENALFYGCVCELQGDWTLIETWALLEPTVIPNPVYYNIQQLGLPIRYVYLDDIKQVLESSYRFFSVERPEDFRIIPSFASDNILNHGIGSSSGSHCQDGQADGVYRIKSFEPKII